MPVTRRTRNTASVEPAQGHQDQRAQRTSSTPEPARRRGPGRPSKSAQTPAAQHVETQVQSVAKVTSTSRAGPSIPAKTTATTTLSKRTTRAAKAAGVASPLRVLEEESKPKRAGRKRMNGQAARASATPEPTPVVDLTTDTDNENEQGMFFSKSEPQVSSNPSTPVSQPPSTYHTPFTHPRLLTNPESPPFVPQSLPSPTNRRSLSPMLPPITSFPLSQLFPLSSPLPLSAPSSSIDPKNSLEDSVRQELFQLRGRVIELETMEIENEQLRARLSEMDELRVHLPEMNDLRARVAENDELRTRVTFLEEARAGLIDQLIEAREQLSIQAEALSTQALSIQAQSTQAQPTQASPVQAQSSPAQSTQAHPTEDQSTLPESSPGRPLLPSEFSWSNFFAPSAPPNTPVRRSSSQSKIPSQSKISSSQQISSQSPPSLSSVYHPLNIWQNLDDEPSSSQVLTGQVEANAYNTGFDSQMADLPEDVPTSSKYINGSESAIALLHKIEQQAREAKAAGALVVDEDMVDVDPTGKGKGKRKANVGESSQRPTPNTTPTHTRAFASPTGFFSRSLSALASRFGFSSPTVAPAEPQEPAPTVSTPSKAPQPNTLTEALSVPPTPVGERTQTAAKKKKKTDPMLKALLKGIDPADKAKAEAWAKDVLPKLKNDRKYRQKLKRMQSPVRCEDLEHFPSCKPWESGFGDPLCDLDDDDLVPGWAVYLDMMVDEEEHRSKKQKTKMDVTSDEDSILSLNDLYGSASSANTSANNSPALRNSHGHSTSLRDLHPRRSTDPSPMFGPTTAHHEGGNVFRERRGLEEATKARADGRDTLQQASKNATSHNPSKGSFSVPDDSSDDEDSSIIEATEVNGSTTTDEGAPRWTQAPPPAPVPAHAPLPEPVAEASSSASEQQPVDELSRQRQKLMKHTPARPSRLREASYPSPSVQSDAGTEPIIAPTPVQIGIPGTMLFDDMPGVETLDVDNTDMEAANALINSESWKQQTSMKAWPAPVVSYESDEENISPL